MFMYKVQVINMSDYLKNNYLWKHNNFNSRSTINNEMELAIACLPSTCSNLHDHLIMHTQVLCLLLA